MNITLSVPIKKYRLPLPINRMKRVGLVTWTVLVVVQWLCFTDKQDLLTTSLTVIGGVVGVTIMLRRSLLAAYPVSSMMIIGYISYYFLLPPLATFFEWKPLTNNLYRPEQVLIHANVFLLFILITHVIYRRWRAPQKLRWIVSRRIYQPFGFFRALSNLHIIAMGSVGLMAMGVQIFIVGIYQGEAIGVVNKLMQGLYPLAYLPYVIIVKKVISPESRIDRKWFFILCVYSVAIIILSLAMNSRAALYAGIASIILVYFYGLTVEVYQISRKTVRHLAFTAVGAIFLLGPVNDIALSMVTVRAMRTDLSAAELVSQTIKVFNDKKSLNLYRLMMKETIRDWDERYVDNLFMARLCNLKFADNSIGLALSIGNLTKDFIRHIELQRILASFPRPIITIFGLPVNKDYVEGASSGDFMYYAVSGNPYALGGYRTGSIFGNGFALFGWWYPFLFSMLVLVIFILGDALTSRSSLLEYGKYLTGWVPVLSPMVVVDFFSWFFFLTSAATGAESISSLGNYILRGWIQVLFIYATIYWLTYIPLRMISRRYV